MSLVIRAATTTDVKAIREIVDTYAGEGQKLLKKETVTLYESVQEFTVAVSDGKVVGCGALHVLWEDLAEVRTVAVLPDYLQRGIGREILNHIIERARAIKVERLFCLTFQTEFFGSLGFSEIDGTPVAPDVYTELLRSYDAGIAEFLNLEAVKPNTLGNTRMLLTL